MAIRVRRGNYADFDKNKLVPGEFSLILDHGVPTGEIYFCVAPGTVRKLATVEELQTLLQASGTAYTALQQLITDLNGNPNELSNILANISTLQNDVATIKSGKFDKANIIQTTAVNDATKVPSSAVTHSLAQSVNTLNENLATVQESITLSSGYSAGEPSYAKRSGNVVMVNMWLIGSVPASTPTIIGTIPDVKNRPTARLRGTCMSGTGSSAVVLGSYLINTTGEISVTFPSAVNGVIFSTSFIK